MKPGHPTRRKFLQLSCLMAAWPSLHALAAPSTGPGPGEGRACPSAQAGLPDLTRLQALLKGRSPLKWVFTGDSITAGVEHTHGYRSYPEIFAERIRWELQRPRDIIINTAISGHTSTQVLEDFSWRGVQFAPAVVSLMIGTNDCAGRRVHPETFRANLKAILTKIRAMDAIPIWQTPNLIIMDKAPERAALPDYVTIMQETATEDKVILVDHWHYWKGMLSRQAEGQLYREWLNDPLHPNGAGHREMARLMFKGLSIFDAAAATCGGPYYEGDH